MGNTVKGLLIGLGVILAFDFWPLFVKYYTNNRAKSLA